MVIAAICLLIALLVGTLLFRQSKRAHQTTVRRSARGDFDKIMGLDSARPVESIVTPEPAPTSISAPTMTVKQHSVPQEADQIIVLHVMASKDAPYMGYELLQAILGNGLRYGKHNIFHRHETKTGRGRILFSLATVNKPGIFELAKMGSFSCPGLTLFMVINRQRDPMLAFDSLLETAKQLVDDLGGEIRDQTNQPLNMDKVAQLRSEIKSYLQEKPVADLFAEV